MSGAGDGDHWSIGDVLSLIQDDFPDVTISKIRFLESQGLIRPERTPSGYRLFREADLDRLRWVLVQQRDNYLPLKVIRDRLEAIGDGPLPEPELEPRSEQLRIGDAALADPPDTAPAGKPELPPDEIEDPPDEPTASPVEVDDPPDEVEDSPDERAAGAEDSLDGGEPEPASPAAGRVEDPVIEDPAIEDPAIEDAEPNPEPTEAEEPEPAPAEVPAFEPDVALTKEELAEAADCSLNLVNDLERYGLVVGREMAATVLYDSNALTVVRLARKFDDFGFEPRHLRSLLRSAEGEIQLFSQVVTPMVRRGDAASVARASDTLSELVELAESLHSVLIRVQIREQMPPGF